jgi:hypothetical protein
VTCHPVKNKQKSLWASAVLIVIVVKIVLFVLELAFRGE